MGNEGIRSGLHTSLWLVVKAQEHLPGPKHETPPTLATPEALKLLVARGISPTKQRKGKSGEIARSRSR